MRCARTWKVCPEIAPHGRVAPHVRPTPARVSHARSRRAHHTVGSIRVKEAQQLQVELAPDRLGEEVCDHDAARDMPHGNRHAGHQVTQKVRGAQDVLGVLKRDRISSDMSTADLESDHSTHGPSHLAPRSTSKSRSHRMSRAAIMAPKYSASALLNDTARCILENQ